MSSWSVLQADTFRQYGRHGLALLLKGLLANRTFRVVVTLRLCQIAASPGSICRALLPLFKIMHRVCGGWAAMDLPWRTEIGAGLSLIHGWGLVVSQGARIGRNVTLFHGATLGRRDRMTREGDRVIGYPILEDEVWVGPHAIIIGDVTIGRGSRIGGGAFVTESVPPFSIVTGNPSSIVKTDCIPDVLNLVPFESPEHT